MKNIIKNIFYLILILFVFLFSSCTKDDYGPSALSSEDSIYYYVDGLMKYWYLINPST